MNKLHISRISWVDVCRGIAIILVLYGHALSNDTQRFLIYAFHMPLFFFLSGVVFKHDRIKSFYSVIVKNFKTILFPYVLFAILTFIVGFIILQPQNYTYDAIMKQIYGVLYGNGNNGYLAYNVALWFLPCLFLVKVFFALLARIINNDKGIILILITFSLFGYYFSAFQPESKLFFGLETAFTGIVFFGAGYLWNKNEKLKHLFISNNLLILCVAIIATITFAWLNFHFYGNQIDMRLNRINNYYLFYLGAFSGITASILLSMIIKKNSLLEYFGKHSLILFVWHTVLFSFFRLHNIPPFKIEFITPIIFVIQASAIIFIFRIFIDKIKIILSQQK